MKIDPAAAELFRAERRTDGKTGMIKLIVAFRSFANVAILLHYVATRN
jgi:hypothetical protein